MGGASVYPSVQNLMLAARNEGLGATLTTILCAFEPQVKELLGIPPELITCAIALGLSRAAPAEEAVTGSGLGDRLLRPHGDPLFSAWHLGIDLGPGRVPLIPTV